MQKAGNMTTRFRQDHAGEWPRSPGVGWLMTRHRVPEDDAPGALLPSAARRPRKSSSRRLQSRPTAAGASPSSRSGQDGNPEIDPAAATGLGGPPPGPARAAQMRDRTQGSRSRAAPDRRPSRRNSRQARRTACRRGWKLTRTRQTGGERNPHAVERARAPLSRPSPSAGNMVWDLRQADQMELTRPGPRQGISRTGTKRGFSLSPD